MRTVAAIAAFAFLTVFSCAAGDVTISAEDNGKSCVECQASSLAAIATARSTVPTGRDSDTRPPSAIPKEIQHRLVTLPFYTVFDSLTFRVEGRKVILSGQVTRPIVRTDAENAVKQITGVSGVDDQVEVLPLSSEDGKIRLAEYLAIYGQAALNEYALRAVPPIHIIVRNRNVTLEGTVDLETDKTLAFTQASTVPGVESVTNHLIVQP